MTAGKSASSSYKRNWNEKIARFDMANHLHKIATEIVQLYHKQLNLLVLCNIAGLKVADFIDYKRGKERIQQLQRELEAMVRAGKGATV